MGVYRVELVCEKQKTESPEYVRSNMIFSIAIENTGVFLFLKFTDWLDCFTARVR
jgi:hypothetical protein